MIKEVYLYLYFYTFTHTHGISHILGGTIGERKKWKNEKMKRGIDVLIHYYDDRQCLMIEWREKEKEKGIKQGGGSALAKEEREESKA